MARINKIAILAIISTLVTSGSSKYFHFNDAFKGSNEFFETSDENQSELNILPEYKVERFVFPPTLPSAMDAPIERNYPAGLNGTIVYRIPAGPKSPGGPGKRVAFIQHGVLCNPRPCNVNKMQIAIVYLLVDQGYDVWLGLSNSTLIENSVSESTEREKLQTVAQYIMMVTDQEELLVMGYFDGEVQFFAMTPPPIPKKTSKFSKWLRYIPGATTVKEWYNNGKDYLARGYQNIKERLGKKIDSSIDNPSVRNFKDKVYNAWGVFRNMVMPTFNIKDFSKAINHPDVYLDGIQLITKYGYAAESHTVRTEDGYLISLHRISGGEKSPPRYGKPVVFLQHGIMGSSVSWLVMGPGKSLAYLLADEGYDVWMGNSRGNTYSKAHINFSTSSAEFWDFSFHEMAVFDLPASIDYVIGGTGQDKIDYIGHSQGTTLCFVMLSEKPEYNEKIKSFVAYAPVVYTNNLRSPIIRFFSSLSTQIWNTLDYLKVREFAPTNNMLVKIGRYICESQSPYQVVCSNTLFMVAGYDSAQINATTISIILGHFPAGGSLKQLYHYGQEFKAKKFQRFDYGSTKENLQRYGQDSPPEYNLNNVKIPVELYSGPNDWLADSADVETLAKNLHKARVHKVPMKLFNHIDFTAAMDAPVLVYHPTIEYLKSTKNKTL